jgi:CRP/FNR family transcriptional regulator, cyclic AMP receptor protein
MLARFGDQRVLLEAIEQHGFVGRNRKFAEEIARVGSLEEWTAGAHIIEQGGSDRDLFLILFGEVSILINGREMALRASNQHVGEMAVIDHRALRSATVVARTHSVTLRIAEPNFVKLANIYPFAWRFLASELAERLRQRGRFVRSVNQIPIVFVGSSSESRPIVDAIKVDLNRDPFIVRPWTLGVFGPSHFALDDLQKQVEECDFAVLVIGPDDKVCSRGTRFMAPRDNVIFELGLFMGVLGRERTFIAQEQGRDLKVPSDLLGLGTIRFDPAASSAVGKRLRCLLCGERPVTPAPLEVRLVKACDIIREKVRELGPR